MKKTFFTGLLLVALMGINISSTIPEENTSLADQVVGIYKGKMRNPTVDKNNHKIKITKINDTKIKIQPKTGNQSQTMEVELEAQTMGSVTVIKFKLPGDHLLNNGMYAEANGRLSYAVHLGGNDPRNIEVFSGKKLE